MEVGAGDMVRVRVSFNVRKFRVMVVVRVGVRVEAAWVRVSVEARIRVKVGDRVMLEVRV